MTNYQNQQPTPNTVLKTLPIIHLALLAGQVLFAIMAFATAHFNNRFDLSGADVPFIYVAPVLAAICFAISTFLYNQQLNQATAKPTLREKVTAYQTAMLLRLAPLEGASLFSIVCYVLTGNLAFLCIAGIIIVFFVIIRPTKDGLQTALNLDYQDIATLTGDDTLTKY